MWFLMKNNLLKFDSIAYSVSPFWMTQVKPEFFEEENKEVEKQKLNVI